MVTAVFPAAGASKRMGDFCGFNKNLFKLRGVPILIRSLQTFSKVERVSFLIVVVGAHEVETVTELLPGDRRLKIVGRDGRRARATIFNRERLKTFARRCGNSFGTRRGATFGERTDDK